MIFSRWLKRTPLARNTLWTILGYGGRILLQGAYFVLLARALGVDGLGLFSGTLALINIFSPFSALGSGNLLIKYTSRHRDVFQLYWGNALISVFVFGILQALLLLPISEYVLGKAFNIHLVIILFFAELIFGRLVDISGQAFQAFDQMRITAQLLLLTSLLRLTLIAILFIFLGTDTSVIIWSWWYLFTSLTAGLCSVAYTCQRLGRPKLTLSLLPQTIREGFFYSLGNASKSIYGDIDKAMLVRMTSAQITGTYTAAYRVISMAFTPVQSLILSSNTRLFQHGAHGLFTTWSYARKLIGFIIVYSSAVIVIGYFAAPLLPWILGNDFQNTVTIFRWLLFLPLIQGLHYLLGDTLMAAGFQGQRSLIQIGVAGLNILLNLLLIPRLSWQGAVIATYISEGVLLLAMIFLLRKKL